MVRKIVRILLHMHGVQDPGAFDQRDPLFFIAKDEKFIARRQVKYFAGLCREGDLSLVLQPDSPKEVFSLRRKRKFLGFHVVGEDVIDQNVIKKRKLLTAYKIRHTVSGFPLGDGLSGYADLFGERLLGEIVLLAELIEIF